MTHVSGFDMVVQRCHCLPEDCHHGTMLLHILFQVFSPLSTLLTTPPYRPKVQYRALMHSCVDVQDRTPSNLGYWSLSSKHGDRDGITTIPRHKAVVLLFGVAFVSFVVGAHFGSQEVSKVCYPMSGHLNVNLLELLKGNVGVNDVTGYSNTQFCHQVSNSHGVVFR